jgi:hypothetical protein
MAITMTAHEFHGLGYQFDPADPTRAIPVATQAESVPDESWDLDQLAVYASTGLGEADRLHRESIQFDRRSTVQVFRSGRALWFARKKVKSEKWGEWGRWLQEHNFKRTSAWEAATLYERAGSEDAVANLTPSEAKIRFGIVKPRGADLEKSVEPGNQKETRGTSQNGGESDDEDSNDADMDDEDARQGPETAEPNDPDVIDRAPITVREMLLAASNLLVCCEWRSEELDVACGEILDGLSASLERLRGKHDDEPNTPL